MKETVLVTLLAFLGNMAYGQSSVDALGGASDAAQRVFDGKAKAVKDTAAPLPALQEEPEFPGGMEGLAAYMKSAVHYPEKAWEDLVQGKVYIEFIVEKDGHVRDAKVERGIRSDLDAEALRAIRTMPPWKPGVADGQAVAVRYVLPVSFKLDMDQGKPVVP